MLRVIYLILIVIVWNASFGFASNLAAPAKQKVTLKIDSSKIKVRYFDKAALNNYLKNPEYQYNDEMQPSFWTRFWRGFWNWFSHFFDFLLSGNHSKGFFKVILIILEYLLIVSGLVAIVFFILKLIGMEMPIIFRRKSLSANLPYSESLENIHDVDFDTEIEKATAQHNYRLAVRMLYLKCLKQLSDDALINWQPDKTNNAYINEINDIKRRMAFKLLTHQFEYVWYGEFAVDSNIFKSIDFMFQKFNNGIA